jgi:pyruvate dehydrogenase E1 component alpha subunit
MTYATPEDPPTQLIDISLDGLPQDALPGWLRMMELIREFERVSSRLSLDGRIPGGMHSSAGQEAVAVGTIATLTADDVITSSHRSHHHALGKGLTPREVMAELYGKETGCLGGRGGHMHLADFDRNLYGSNGIVGGGLGIALGVAVSFQIRHLARVAIGCFGDGGANTGRVWEFVNLAALWRLPLIIICENNHYAVETHISRATAGGSISRRAEGFGLPVVTADGQDVGAIYRVTSEARARALAGEGPTFIEAVTYRYEGHNTGDVQNYRTQDEVAAWRAEKDPIERLRRAMLRDGLITQDGLDAVAAEVAAEVQDSVAFAEDSPWPDPATVMRVVTAQFEGATR